MLGYLQLQFNRPFVFLYFKHLYALYNLDTTGVVLKEVIINTLSVNQFFPYVHYNFKGLIFIIIDVQIGNYFYHMFSYKQVVKFI